MTDQRMYGLWASPITPASLAASARLAEPCWDTSSDTLAWVEGRSARGVIVLREGDCQAPRDLDDQASTRAMVGYGGGDFTLHDGTVFYVEQESQRIFRQPIAGGPARPITPKFGEVSSPRVSPDGRWLVYVHTYEGQDAIAIVHTDGKHWPARLASGRDFYMQPAWSPDGTQLAWVEWDHPQMPWDGTELVLATLAPADDGDFPSLGEWETIAGDTETAIYQPEFATDGTLRYLSDATGWGHLYAYSGDGDAAQLTSGPAEHSQPAWTQGGRRYAVLPDGRIAAIRSEAGFDTLVLVDPTGNELPLPVGDEYTTLEHPVVSPDGHRLALVASGGTQPPRVITVDLESAALSVTICARSAAESVPTKALSAPEPVSWTSFDGEQAHGIYYPPASARFESDGLPPLVVLVHGGPTSQTKPTWHPPTQFLATRGIAVLHVNYRGSTGHGRDYMLKLRHSWGIYDVQDCATGAQALAERGLVDGDKLVIMGGSAGGYTVLQSLVETPGVYKAGVCLYGVANMFTLASDTHKFEERYLDSMLGPLPEAAAVYRDRSPIFHAEKIVDPIAVFQGEIDRVVPKEQSDSIVASLRARGIPHEYHVYEGEGHGWRKSETVEQYYTALEAFLRQYVVFA